MAGEVQAGCLAWVRAEPGGPRCRMQGGAGPGPGLAGLTRLRWPGSQGEDDGGREEKASWRRRHWKWALQDVDGRVMGSYGGRGLQTSHLIGPGAGSCSEGADQMWASWCNIPSSALGREGCTSEHHLIPISPLINGSRGWDIVETLGRGVACGE